jgi:hypothetical protein
MRRLSLTVARVACALLLLYGATAAAQVNRADGFSKLPSGTKVALMPADVELYQLTAGGIPEPRADWTAAAVGFVKELYKARKAKLGAEVVEVADDADEALLELNRLHGAVAGAIAVHHFGILALPTKEQKLDWTLGPGVGAVREKSGADYALFVYIRDSYATGERVAAMIIGAMFGVGLPGGIQAAYASLVDLKTGQIVWFNQLLRPSGDLRERDKAQETLDALLSGYPE